MEYISIWGSNFVYLVCLTEFVQYNFTKRIPSERLALLNLNLLR